MNKEILYLIQELKDRIDLEKDIRSFHDNSMDAIEDPEEDIAYGKILAYNEVIMDLAEIVRKMK